VVLFHSRREREREREREHSVSSWVLSLDILSGSNLLREMTRLAPEAPTPRIGFRLEDPVPRFPGS
jgi:hypothetical protein